MVKVEKRIIEKQLLNVPKKYDVNSKKCGQNVFFVLSIVKKIVNHFFSCFYAKNCFLKKQCQQIRIHLIVELLYAIVLVESGDRAIGLMRFHR